MPITTFGLGNLIWRPLKSLLSQNGKLSRENADFGRELISAGNAISGFSAITHFDIHRCPRSSRAPDEGAMLIPPVLNKEQLVAAATEFAQRNADTGKGGKAKPGPALLKADETKIGVSRGQKGKPGKKEPGGAPAPAEDVPQPGPSGLYDPEPPVKHLQGRCYQRQPTRVEPIGFFFGAINTIIQTPTIGIKISGKIETEVELGGIGGQGGCPEDQCIADWVQSSFVGKIKLAVGLSVASGKLPGLDEALAKVDLNAEAGIATPHIQFQHWPTNGEANDIPVGFKVVDADIA